jgi:hypothetical protein
MANDPQGNPVKAVFKPETGVTQNFIATNPDIPVPDRKHDYLHGHIDLLGLLQGGENCDRPHGQAAKRPAEPNSIRLGPVETG